METAFEIENRIIMRLKKVRIWSLIFIFGLIVSGLTALPLRWEMEILIKIAHYFPNQMQHWLQVVKEGVLVSFTKYTFLAYGTDWLAFAHILLAILFLGVFTDPVKNQWITQFGMVACVMVIPFAFVMGFIREIPFFWQMIDCLFGIFGLIPLYIIHNQTIKLKSGK